MARMDRASGDFLPRSDWTREQVEGLFALPFHELMFRAQCVHRRHFEPGTVQVSTLLSIKTGACPEDCKYCPQSVRYDTGLAPEQLLEVERVVETARAAKDAGASRFCMGAAWRSPKDRDIPVLAAMVREVKALGLESCMTLGMLEPHQARALAEAGLDYYNHNIDTSPEFYGEIVTTRRFQQRLDTLAHVREAGIKVCCGGIVGMGEAREDRAGMLLALATLPEHPGSVPVNLLVRVPGTPLAGEADLDPFEFVRTIAVARILMPASHVRLSAGREHMSDEMQALCFLAGANSIFHGERLLTTANPEYERDRVLFERLGLRAEHREADAPAHAAGTASAVPAGAARQALYYDAARA
jgi:biotin synthase